MPKYLIALVALACLFLLGAADAPAAPAAPELRPHIAAQVASLPLWHQDSDEEEEHRAWRIDNVARGVALAADLATCTGDWRDEEDCEPAWPVERKLELVGALISQGWWESRYAQHVHEGRCRVHIGECDGGKARSPWQIQTSALVTDVEWYDMLGAGEEPTEIAARCAARILAVGLKRCGSLEGAISSYATGRTCKWSKAADRVRHARRMTEELTRRIACAQSADDADCTDEG